jgi:hypothetical protein
VTRSITPAEVFLTETPAFDGQPIPVFVDELGDVEKDLR